MSAMSCVIYKEVDATGAIKASGMVDLLLGKEEGLEVNRDLDVDGIRFGVRAAERGGGPADTVVMHYQIAHQPERASELELNLVRSELRTQSGKLTSLSPVRRVTLSRLVQASVAAGVDRPARVVG
jgi:hypothetical protein